MTPEQAANEPDFVQCTGPSAQHAWRRLSGSESSREIDRFPNIERPSHPGTVEMWRCERCPALAWHSTDHADRSFTVLVPETNQKFRPGRG